MTRSPFVAAAHLVLLLAAVCAAMAILAGVALAGFVVQLSVFGH